ncbi:glycosyltransferase family 2 protein [Flavobacterium sp.]|jgi:glycosyltransferase involved in cell wall biosynthesis|uniref:glycosyltransferase family 2 protein n=1 Tax=Flavobacterium sp. TaxID=239 RepID=UPI002A7EB589|nr:glycosyltransferase family 2 protein [Flavobacterium sp.]
MMNQEKPFFSIITASFNSEKTIYKTIESILNLDFTEKPFEYIIIDGNSSDKTLEIIKSFESKFLEKNITFSYISEPDKGIYDAWNKGVKLSKGNWISFIGSDDMYLPFALTKYYNSILNCPVNVNYISSKVEIIDSNYNPIRVIGSLYVWGEMIRGMNIAQVGSFHKDELFEKNGFFSTEYKIVGDLDFYIRSKSIIIPEFFESITAKMQNGGVSNQIFKALKEAMVVKLKYKYTAKALIYYDFLMSLTKCYIKIIIKK